MAKYLTFFVLIILSVQINAFSNDKFNVFLDVARFRYDESHTYVEIYYLVNLTDSLTEDSNAFLEFNILKLENDSLLASESMEVKFKKDKLELIKIGLVKTLLQEGKYIIRLLRYADNLKTNVKDSMRIDLSISSFVQEKITLSDLELCKNIIPRSTNKGAVFYKNTMEVLPNPSRLYGKDNPRLFYYIELYNTKSEQPQNKFDVQIVIADKDGLIRSRKDYKRPPQYESLVENGVFNVSNLETGIYTLIFAVSDSSNNYSVYRRANFFIDNPQVALVNDERDLKILEYEFQDLPSDVIDKMFRQARYIATHNEQNIYKSLNDIESRRKFLIQFWETRIKENPNIKDKYFDRVEYANKHFKATGNEGWETDRGRVYMVYGPPDDIERYPFDVQQNPYEIWFYETLEGGSEFDFVDISGYGNYQLVNSTYRREVQDPNWRLYLNK